MDDILRYTYTASSEELTEKTIKSIEMLEANGYNTVEIKNYWINPNDPYNGVNTFVADPSGQKFELQYHTPESFAVKNGELHLLYEKQRIIKDTSSPEWIALHDQMNALSKATVFPKGIEKVR